MSDQEYWVENFDPKLLRITDLRRILLENNIGFSGQDKKNELVKVFKANIRSIRCNAINDRGWTVKSGKVVKKKVPKRKKSTILVKKKEELETNNNNVKIGKQIQSVVCGDNVSEENMASGCSEVIESKKKHGSRKRKNKECKEWDSEESEDCSVVNSIGKSRLKKRKARKESCSEADMMDGDLQKSPIVCKVQAKQALTRSEHKSLIINKFESSEEEFSFNSTPGNKRILVFNEELDKKLELHNFRHLGKKNVTPELSKLKVSSELKSMIANSRRKREESEDRFVSASTSEKSISIDQPSKVESTIKQPDERLEATQEKLDDPYMLKGDPTIKPEALNVFEKEKKRLPQKDFGQQENSTTTTEQANVGLEDTSKITHLKDEAMLKDTLLCTSEEVKVKRPSKPQKLFKWALRFFIKILKFVIIVLPLLLGLWYREQRILVGYCGHSIDHSTFTNIDKYPGLKKLENNLQKFKPKCLPCPENAICYPNMVVRCKTDYVLTPSLFSLSGLFPVSDKCIKDSNRELMVAEVVHKSLELLKTKNAQIECGECEDDFKSGISEPELRQIFFESKVPWMNDEEFQDIWRQVISNLKSQPEVIFRQMSTNSVSTTVNNECSHSSTKKTQLSTTNSFIQEKILEDVETNSIKEHETSFSDGKEEYFRSISKKYIGIRCQFERQVYRTYQKYKVIFLGSITVIILLQLLKMRFQYHFQELEMVERLQSQVIEKLKAAVASEEDLPKFLSTVQLRDVLLSDFTDLKYKNKLWNKMVKKLESNNTNIKSMLMEVHGEIMKCWEWIGPVH